jgi:hypothetical protein
MNNEDKEILREFCQSMENFLESMDDNGLLTKKGKRLRHIMWTTFWSEKSRKKMEKTILNLYDSKR